MWVQSREQNQGPFKQSHVLKILLSWVIATFRSSWSIAHLSEVVCGVLEGSAFSSTDLGAVGVTQSENFFKILPYGDWEKGPCTHWGQSGPPTDCTRPSHLHPVRM